MKKFLILFACLIASLNYTFAQFPPPPPTGLVAGQVGLTNSVNISWTAPVGAINGYKVYYSSPADPLDSVTLGSSVTSLNLSNLLFNQSYTFNMKAFRVVGPDTLRSTATGNAIVLVVGLVAPSPTADLGLVTHNFIGLQITDSNVFETGFDVELTENGNITTVVAAAGSSVFQPLTNLKPKTGYSIRVRAKYNSLAGPWSSSIFVATKVGFPPAPILSSDLNCPTLINLKWSIPSRAEDIEEYILKKSYDNVTFYDLDKPALTLNNYFDQTALAGATQYYALFARNSTGSTASNTVAVTAQAFQKPNAPLNPISDQGNKSRNHLTIRWTNGSEDQTCKTNIRTNTIVMIKTNNTGDFKQYANLPAFASSVKIENLNPKDIVDVAIFAVSDKGLFSNPANIRDTTAGPPYAPTNPIAVFFVDALGNPVFDISWKDNSKDEDYFIVERSLDNKTFAELGKIKMNINSFKDLTPEEATIYYYRVKAGSNTEGESAYSPSIGPFIVNPTKAPNAPYGLKAKENAGKVNLTWYDDSKREESYIIEKSLDAGVNYSLVATLGKNVTSYTDENVSAGKTYLYRVIAKNAIGSSANSNIATIKMSGVGSSPNPITLSVYPNPAFETLNIKVNEIKSESVYNLRIFDRNNRQVLYKTIKFDNAEAVQIPVFRLNQGLYNVVITNGETSISKKIFKY
ncbi:fibronectin type III domain-containing protein [Lacihabitans soyangensis]|uniref:T9SS C-terminal target domain-containing protein n=1 Tax=Lacihabitans soyangensis TaxID=869394 RepID=A0AAE3H1W2_9BACT|nr:fibronectin type III domain-containing protein [Lacihabitans soyangensis]MCP9762740.1 T9SS C-terminal target domain-containing protein [Lacihabitans soyangensis]